MHIESFREIIHACRFCFMCRHLSPVGNVTFREADTPRGRALFLDNALTEPRLLELPDYREAVFNADLSAACRHHCVSHYDEAGLILAARRDIVEANQAPAAVKQLADELVKAEITTRGDETAEVVIFENHLTASDQPEITVALGKILKAAGLSFRVVSSADCGKALSVLGYHAEASAHAAKVVRVIAKGSAKILVTSCPASYHAFQKDYPAFGVPFGQNLEILHSSELILRLLSEGRFKCKRDSGKKVFPLASDYLRNYFKNNRTVDQLLEALGVENIPFGTNREESYSAGEGAVVLDRLNPKLVEKLSQYVTERIQNPATDILLTASPYTKHALLKYGGMPVQVTTVEELTSSLIQ
jgi:Fe-S oxidoreductase